MNIIIVDQTHVIVTYQFKARFVVDLTICF